MGSIARELLDLELDYTNRAIEFAEERLDNNREKQTALARERATLQSERNRLETRAQDIRDALGDLR